MVNDIFRNSPSCENAFGALRRARQTRNIKNNSLKYGQSTAEAIQIVSCRDICKNNARVFHLPQEGCGKPGRVAFTSVSAVGAGVVHDLGGGQLAHGRAAQGAVQLGTVGGKGIVQLLALQVA